MLRHGEPATPGPFAAQTLNTASRIKSRSFNVVSRALCNLSLLRAQTRLAHCCLQSILQPGAAIFRLPTTCSRHQNRTRADSPNPSSSSSVTGSCSSRKSFRFPSVLLRPYPHPKPGLAAPPRAPSAPCTLLTDPTVCLLGGLPQRLREDCALNFSSGRRPLFITVANVC